MNSKPTSSLHKLKNYHFQERLGKGQYAQVMKAINRTTKTPCAIKVLDNLQIKLQPIVLKLLKSEISILQTVNNPNVVKLYEYLHENNHHYLVMEYCNGGDLEEYFKKSIIQIKEDFSTPMKEQMITQKISQIELARHLL